MANSADPEQTDQLGAGLTGSALLTFKYMYVIAGQDLKHKNHIFQGKTFCMLWCKGCCSHLQGAGIGLRKEEINKTKKLRHWCGALVTKNSNNLKSK